MPTIISLAVAFVVGLGLQKLISYKIVLPGSAIDYGRVWSGWVVFFTTLALLTGFLIYLDLERLAVWILAVLFYGGCAFGAGWAYGKFFKGDTAESIEAERSLNPSSHIDDSHVQNIVKKPDGSDAPKIKKTSLLCRTNFEKISYAILLSVVIIFVTIGVYIYYHDSLRTRNLTANEIRLLDVTGAPKRFRNTHYFDGTIYNGNSSITITSFTVDLSTYRRGRQETRSYLVNVNINPLSTEQFQFDIMERDSWSASYWDISAAKGHPNK